MVLKRKYTQAIQMWLEIQSIEGYIEDSPAFQARIESSRKQFEVVLLVNAVGRTGVVFRANYSWERRF
jgi:hypothetical protein